MLPKFKKLSLEKQLFLSFFSVSACLLVLSLSLIHISPYFSDDSIIS